ncbi:hypothetical protein Pint_20969 [Pistacia integerrima]|uniref:Uncharacterized protein n=1 Tax=Pistacia integerrima TaxID=434235 RepID=A0ACC0XGH1_9ROSI|nr:hypothetical protein Pint_20969 [Pistacia integerrima]
MAPSAATADSSPPPSTSGTTENHLQPVFVLHKAASRKYGRKSTGTTKTKRRIDLSSSIPKNFEKTDSESTEDFDDDPYVNLRMEAFEIVWTKIESTIKDVLWNINTNVFNEIGHWVRESFNTIKSFGMLTSHEATQAFPIMKDVSSKQLFTGLVLTKNMEFVDDLLTFEELGHFLKSQGCHVANLSSLDFMAKSGIGGCLRSLLRQFVGASSDAIDMSIMASWYRGQGNYNNPVVVIVNDIERCSGSILSNFILMLSEWVLKVPVILIMGVATTLDAPKSILPSNVLQCLSSYKFTLGTPAERMDAVVDAVFVKQCSGFIISHKVAVFMSNYFVRQDGTLTSFVRALKVACVQHFSMEPLSFLIRGFSLEEDGQVLHDGLLSKMILKHAFNLPSYERNKIEEQSVERFAIGLSRLKRLKNQWGTMVSCLYEAAKGDKIQLLDLLREALDPTSCNSTTSNSHIKLEKDIGASSSKDCQQYPMLRRGGFICQAVRKVKDLPASQLWKLLKRWEGLTMNVNEMHEKIKELLSLLKLENGKSSKQHMVDISKFLVLTTMLWKIGMKDLKFELEMGKRNPQRNHARRNASQSQFNIEDSKVVNVKAAALMECMVWDYMQPIECLPFHEIICFKNVEKLQLALIGDPRRRIQVDLLEFYKILRCSCCSRIGDTLSPSMHDTSIMYNLAQEHGDYINLHDWYNSFKSTVLCPINKGKNKSKQSPIPKKRKEMNEPKKQSEASIQYPLLYIIFFNVLDLLT